LKSQGCIGSVEVDDIVTMCKLKSITEDVSNCCSEKECAICMEEFSKENPATKPCSASKKHCFHQNCINQWIGHKGKTCPSCRSALIDDYVQPQIVNREAIAQRNEDQAFLNMVRQATNAAMSSDERVRLYRYFINKFRDNDGRSQLNTQRLRLQRSLSEDEKRTWSYFYYLINLVHSDVFNIQPPADRLRNIASVISRNPYDQWRMFVNDPLLHRWQRQLIKEAIETGILEI
jgi:hypothetical protein